MSVESVLQRVATLEQALANPAALLATAARSGGTVAPSATAPPAGSPAGGSSFAEALQSASAGYAPGSSALATPAESPSAQSASPTASPALPSAYTGAGASSTGTYTPTTGTLSPSYPASALGASTGVAGLTPMLGTSEASTGARIVAIAESQAGQAEQPPGSNESPAIAGYRTATVGAIPGAPWCAYFASWAARQAGAPLGNQGEGLGSVSEIWSWAQSSGRAIANGPGVVPQPGDLIVFGGEHVGIVKDVLPNGDIQTIEGNYENKVALNTRTPTEATGYVNMS
jgi:CHAP domain